MKATGRRSTTRPRAAIALGVLLLTGALVATALAGSNFRFAKPRSYATGPNPIAIATGDFDRDKRLDLAISDFGGSVGEVPALTIVKGKKNGRFKPVDTFPAVLQPDGIEAARIDGDPDLDLVVGGFGVGQIAVYPGGPGMTFGPPAEYSVGGVANSPRWIATGDFNSDGRTDIAASDQGTNELEVLLAAPGGGFETAVHYPAGANGRLIAARVNRDKRPDLVLCDSLRRRLLIFTSRPNGTLAGPVARKMGLLPIAVAAGDLNRDRRTDLVAVGPDTSANIPGRLRRGTSPTAPSSVAVSLARKGGSFKRPMRFRIGRIGVPRDLALARLNGDGKLDVAATMEAANQVALLPGRGAGRFGKARMLGTGLRPQAIVARRFDSNRSADLAVTEGPDDSLSVYLNRSR